MTQLNVVSEQPINEDVVGYIEYMLHRAKSGLVRSVYICGVEDDGLPTYGHVGDGCPFVGLASIKLLERHVLNMLDNDLEVTDCE